MEIDEHEEKLLRSVTLQNAQSILSARERAERELLQTKEALERKTTELARQREWFRVALSSIGDAVITTNAEGRITFLNSVAEAMTGWKSPEALGEPLENVFKLIHEQTRQPAANPVSKVLAEGTAVDSDNRTALLTRNGREIAIEDSAAPIKDPAGKVSGAVMVFHDVTARRKAHDALQRSERLLSDFFENAAVGLHWVGPDGRILRANRTELNLLGYSHDEYIGRHISEFHADAPVIDEILKKLGCGETLENCEARLRCKDGSIRHVLISSNVLWEDGKFIHTRCFTRDITKQKLAEQALRESENRKSAILSVALDAIITMDHEGKVLDFNPAAEATFGRRREDVIGQSLAELIIPERLRHRHSVGLARYLSSGEGAVLGRRIEMPALHADGHEFPVELSISAISNVEPPMFTATLRDITERKRVEESLRKSEERLRATFNQAAVGMAIAGLDGRFEQVNETFSQILGYTREELLERTVAGLTHPDDLPKTESFLQRLMAGEISDYSMEKRYIRKDGALVWSLTTVTLLKNAEGRAERFIGVIEDITQRKAVEVALRESEDRFRTAFTNAAIGVAITDVAGNFVDGNPAYSAITGYGKEELTQLKLANLVHPEDFEENMALLRQILDGLRPAFVIRNRYRRKDGTIVWVQKSVSMVRDGHGRAQRFVALIEDITDRQQAEEALRERARLAVLRSDISAALVSGETLPAVLQRCTESLVEHLDASFARIWTLGFAEDTLHLRASAGIYTHLNGSHGRVKVGNFKIGRIAQNRQPHLTNDVQNDPNVSDPAWAKREGIVAFAGYPLIVEDHVVGVIALFARKPFAEEMLKELSLIANGLAQWIQRKQAEHALRDAQEKLSRHAGELEKQVADRTATLRETIGELEAFSYSISHDMRAPLRAMQSFAHILEEDCAGQVSATGREYIRRITTAAERMDRLIQDVLSYSRVTRTDLPLEDVEVKRLLEGILESYPMFQSPAAEIRLAGIFPAVLGNEAALTQCISNLFGNAIKFVAPGVIPRVKVWAEATSETVRIYFQDNGVGIEKDAHATIFGIFQRVSKRYEGTGIGLAIVKKAAERMGGNVGLDSSPGKGSTFWLELKRANAEIK